LKHFVVAGFFGHDRLLSRRCQPQASPTPADGKGRPSLVKTGRQPTFIVAGNPLVITPVF
jgi:hypothetical protein